MFYSLIVKICTLIDYLLITFIKGNYQVIKPNILHTKHIKVGYYIFLFFLFG